MKTPFLKNFKIALRSEKCKVLVFSLVWSFNSHALNILSADDLGEFSGILQKSPKIVSGQNVQSMWVKRSDLQKD